MAMRARYLILPAVALAAPAAAGSGLQSCDDLGVGLWSVVAGADKGGVRTYYDGRVTLLEVDTVEPGAVPAGVAFVIPDRPDVEGISSPQCWAIINYASVDVRRAQAQYDAATGLTLTIPARDYDGERAVPAAPIRVRINAGQGTIVDLNAR
jgi:hypothetical protein